MPHQSGNSVSGRTGFSKSWGLRASVSFSPFPSPFTQLLRPPQFSRGQTSEKRIERVESLTETLATQAIPCAMWGKVSCLRKQHDGRDWASNHRPSDLVQHANHFTTAPPPSPRHINNYNSGTPPICPWLCFPRDLKCSRKACARATQ